MNLAIPKDREAIYRHIENACIELDVFYTLYDIYSSNWIEDIQAINPNGCIYSGEFRYAAWRDLFKERIRFISHDLGIPIYPRMHEYDLWESKRKMAYWLQANQIPHARTWVFGNKDQALEFIQSAKYPLIFKTDFGNASFGVRKLENPKQAMALWRQSFGNGYRIPTYKPYESDLKSRFKALVRPAYRRVRGIRDIPRDVELDVMLFQEMIDIQHEWRIVKSGDSYFGHQKLPNRAGMHSGSSLSSWTIPPIELFNFTKYVCEKGRFSTMCIDVFEDNQGRYFVNELQAIFGVIANNQMYRQVGDSLIGLRFYYDSNMKTWQEGEGEFGQDYHYRSRVNDFIANL
jgi:hypothetical protein